jgi:hypothetical protein
MSPADPKRDETIDWLGEDFDPVYFHPEDANPMLARFAEK